jgi:hypothetical protein
VRTTGTFSLKPGSRVYVHDNRAPDFGITYSALVTLTGGNVIPNLMTTTSVAVWNTGLVARPTADNEVYSRVLGLAGRASRRSRLRRQTHRAERAPAFRQDHQLCVVQWQYALQQECRRLAVIPSESSDSDAAIESGLDRVQRL